MKTIESSILYSRVTIQPSVPTTVEEIDTLVGEDGAAVAGFNADCLARNFLPRLYSKVSAELAPRFPIKPSGKTQKVTKKNAAGVEETTDVPVDETDIKHVGRVWEENESERANITSLLQKYSSGPAAIPFYAEGDRGGSGKIAEKFVQAANEIVAAGGDKANAVAEKIEAAVPGYKVERDAETNTPTAGGLARGMAALNRHFQEQAKNAAAAAMAV